MPKPSDKGPFTTHEAAELLGVERVTVYNYIHKGKIKAKKFSRDYVITSTAIAEFKKAGFSKVGGRPKLTRRTKTRKRK